MLDFGLRSVQRRVSAVVWLACGWLGTLQVSVASLWVARYVTMIKQTQRRIRIDLNNTVICTTKEQVLDTKRDKLT
jgi:hypothetical protein